LIHFSTATNSFSLLRHKTRTQARNQVGAGGRSSP